MRNKGNASRRHFKKRLKLIAKSKARRAELNKKQKQRVDYIAKEVEALRKKREKEFFRVVEQRKLAKKLKLLAQTDEITEIDHKTEDSRDSTDDIPTENDSPANVNDVNIASQEKFEEDKVRRIQRSS